MVEFIETAARFKIRSRPIRGARAHGVDHTGWRPSSCPTSTSSRRWPLAQKLLTKRFAPERMGTDALKLAQSPRSPCGTCRRSSGSDTDLQRGIQIATVDRESPALREEIRHAGFRISMALTTRRPRQRRHPRDPLEPLVSLRTVRASSESPVAAVRGARPPHPGGERHPPPRSGSSDHRRRPLLFGGS